MDVLAVVVGNPLCHPEGPAVGTLDELARAVIEQPPSAAVGTRRGACNCSRMTERPTHQNLLVAFDFDATDERPYLSVRGLQSALLEHRDVVATRETIRDVLTEMKFEGRQVVCRKRDDEWVWRATIGPRLAPEVAEDLKQRRDDEEYVPLDDIE